MTLHRHRMLSASTVQVLRGLYYVYLVGDNPTCDNSLISIGTGRRTRKTNRKGACRHAIMFPAAIIKQRLERRQGHAWAS